jgi:hypothetical protein
MYQQKISKYKNTHDARQRKYEVKMLDTEIMRLYKEKIRKGNTEYNKQQNNQNEVGRKEEKE